MKALRLFFLLLMLPSIMLFANVKLDKFNLTCINAVSNPNESAIAHRSNHELCRCISDKLSSLITDAYFDQSTPHGNKAFKIAFHSALTHCLPSIVVEKTRYKINAHSPQHLVTAACLKMWHEGFPQVAKSKGATPRLEVFCKCVTPPLLSLLNTQKEFSVVHFREKLFTLSNECFQSIDATLAAQALDENNNDETPLEDTGDIESGEENN